MLIYAWRIRERDEELEILSCNTMFLHAAAIILKHLFIKCIWVLSDWVQKVPDF